MITVQESQISVLLFWAGSSAIVGSTFGTNERAKWWTRAAALFFAAGCLFLWP